MRTVTNVCRSCGRANVPDDEYLPAMSLCGDCVASQISQTREQMNQMQDQINRLEQSGTRNTPPGRESSPPEGCVRVEGGTFQMGSPAGEPVNYDIGRPMHSVTISSFYMKATPVTQGEWRKIMGNIPSPSFSTYEGDDLPVKRISWFDAVEYCNALSRHAGRSPVYRMSGNTVLANWSVDGFRLPTEAEWEYAAGSGIISEGYRYLRSSKNKRDSYREWCWDWYGAYSSKSKTNPRGPSRGSERVYRIWEKDSYQKVAYRCRQQPFDRSCSTGFRLVFRT